MKQLAGATFTLLLALWQVAGAEPAQAVRARRTPSPPTIDGVLGDPAWRRAAVLPPFTQRRPAEGKAPQHKTEVRVLYGEDALYVAFRMWDRQPEQIRRGLGRRDNPPDSDKVLLYLDPLRTRDRGYFFQINASGVLADGVIFSETSWDASWDAVWTGVARVDDRGWTAEMAIPLTSIAFQDRSTQSWGIYVERYVTRIKETSCWPPMPKDTNTFVSRFGLLEGLVGLKRRAALRLVPYLAGEVLLGRRSDSLRPEESFRPNAGVDLRYGLSGDLLLHATINPDFGQVEDDPAVVNLSPNEVFFGERRPFFVAGAELFRTPLTLLHTRRIGARPVAPDPEDDAGEIVELDPEARIIGAAKLVGEHGPASFGVLTATVLPTYALERRPDGSTQERLASRGTHYGAARLRLRAGRTSLGAIVTGMTRLDEADAYSGGVDWDIRSRSGWQTTGQLTGATAAEGSGYGFIAVAGQKGASRWRYWLEGESFSERYEINDVGFQWRDDMVRLRGYLQHRLPAPWRCFRDWDATLKVQYGFNHTDPSLAFDRRVELGSYLKLENLWGIWTGIGWRFFTLDDQETRGGIAYPRPQELYGWLGGETDTSRRAVLSGTASFSHEGESADSFYLDAKVQVQAMDRLNLSLLAIWRLQRNFPRWVETLDYPPGPRQIFGDLDRDELELRLSGLVSLHRLLTFQLFGQVLHSVGTYDRYRELFMLYDGSTTLGPTAYDAGADFSTTHLIVNAILRWDLGAGTAAYLVYKIDGALDRSGEPPISFDLGGSLSSLLRERQTHLLLFKVSYGFGI